MRILYITSSLPFGHGEAFLVPEIEELLARHEEVVIVPMHPRGELDRSYPASLREHAEVLPLLSARILLAALQEAFHRPKRIFDLALEVLGTGRWLVRLKNLAVLPKAVWLASFARRWRPDHIHCHWGGCTATMAMVVSELTGVDMSITLHRWDILENNCLELKARKASFLRFISADGRQLADRLGVLQEERALVLHLGVHVPREIDRSGAGPANADARSRPVGLCPAALIPRKGHKFLFEALQTLRVRNADCEIWLAGEGHLQSHLQDLVKELGLSSQVRFLGRLEHTALLNLYREQQVDFVVLPSLHEGIPVSLIEAMGYGVPAISTPTGGTGELLAGGAGLLVPARDSVSLADAIEQLVRDGVARRTIGLRGRTRVQQEYRVETIVEELLQNFRGAPVPTLR